jgi:hypothetical protein
MPCSLSMAPAYNRNFKDKMRCLPIFSFHILYDNAPPLLVCSDGVHQPKRDGGNEITARPNGEGQEYEQAENKKKRPNTSGARTNNLQLVSVSLLAAGIFDFRCHKVTGSATSLCWQPCSSQSVNISGLGSGSYIWS